MRIRLLLRKIVGADALTTWGSVVLWSVAAGGLATCVMAARGLDVGQSVLIGCGLLSATGFMTLACVGFVDSETLTARKRLLEGAIVDLFPAAMEERRAAADDSSRSQREQTERQAVREAWEAERPVREADRLAKANARRPLTACKTCGSQVSQTAPTCPHCGENLPGQRIACPKCNSSNVTAGERGFSNRHAALGGFLLGDVGLLLGLSGKHKPVFVCQGCGHKWER